MPESNLLGYVGATLSSTGIFEIGRRPRMSVSLNVPLKCGTTAQVDQFESRRLFAPFLFSTFLRSSSLAWHETK
jgi:hypothetical protein